MSVAMATERVLLSATYIQRHVLRRLKALGEFEYLDELTRFSEADLLAVKGFARRSVREIKEELREHGLELAPSVAVTTCIATTAYGRRCSFAPYPGERYCHTHSRSDDDVANRALRKENKELRRRVLRLEAKLEAIQKAVDSLHLKVNE